jgi:hypothetical protein
MHPGKTLQQAKAEGVVVMELKRWGLDGHTELADPGEIQLRLVTQSAARVEFYAGLLGRAYEAAERLREAHAGAALLVAAGSANADEGEDPAVQAARLDLERIFATGGVGALIGVKRDADRFGRVFETEEAIRGLALLEAQERDRCSRFSTQAIAAGLAERQVRLAESQGAAMFAVFGRVQRRLLEALDLSAEQGQLAAALLPRLLAEEVGALTGRQAIEGSVAG